MNSNRTLTRPTWAEISLRRLGCNYRWLRERAAPAAICAVVKADAYGHGCVPCARALAAAGAQWFGATATDDGVQLREAGITGRILLLSGFWRGEEEDVVRHQLTPVVWEAWHIERLDAAAAKLKNKVHLHLSVDTGMGREGAAPAELPKILGTLRAAQHVVLDGLCSHLAASQVVDSPQAAAQVKRFRSAEAELRAAGFQPGVRHLANSSAVVTPPPGLAGAEPLELVRSGFALYGYLLPLVRGGREEKAATPLEPVLAWKTRIISLRNIDANQPLGYDGIFVTRAPSRIAVLPVGYADGFNRKLSNGGRVIVRGVYAPIVGRISMDLTLVDVTHVPGAEAGDEVILLGENGDCRIDAWEHARLAETTAYEILCAISDRVPRRYRPE
jgi:alanine racemase